MKRISKKEKVKKLSKIYIWGKKIKDEKEGTNEKENQEYTIAEGEKKKVRKLSCPGRVSFISPARTNLGKYPTHR